MNKRSLYLGGGFRDHQILYMIPIIEGICSRKKDFVYYISKMTITQKIYSKKNLFKFF